MTLDSKGNHDDRNLLRPTGLPLPRYGVGDAGEEAVRLLPQARTGVDMKFFMRLEDGTEIEAIEAEYMDTVSGPNGDLDVWMVWTKKGSDL